MNHNQKIKKVLIANRGEIVIRIHKTLKKMNIETVSIYSDADVNSMHRYITDESINIGGISPNESYCSFEKILHAVRASGADSVHPGFGFLSENAEFAAFMSQNNITFIGPSSNCIKMLGDKIESKILAKQAEVSVIPGLIEPIEDLETAAQVANQIGYPVMLKAASGGGGKGMRVVWNEGELSDSFHLVISEAISNFKDKNIFLEKYIEEPRHIEIQILADNYGNVVHLGERECSIQRRNQKIIEEAPSPFFESLGQKGVELREKMGRQAINLAKKINYYSVGTVEFVVDKNKNFYFLEVNTRIQVEHPVTEETIRIKSKPHDKKIDLVEWMVRIANGEKINFGQSDIYFEGNCIEARIYAENSEKNFIPSSGKIEKFNFPNSSEIRIESGVQKGSEITPYYDPMIAKICSYGMNRDKAIQVMQNALAQTVIFGHGLHTNVIFLEDIFSNSNFQKGIFNTNFIRETYGNNYKSNINIASIIDHKKLMTMIIAHAILCLENIQFLAAHDLVFSSFIEQRLIFTVLNGKDRENYLIHIIKNNQKITLVSINQNEINQELNIISLHNNLLQLEMQGNNCITSYLYFKFINLDFNYNTIEFQGKRLSGKIYTENEFSSLQHIICHNDNIQDLENKKPILRSSLPGVISEIMVKEGDIIDENNKILIIESMKMQNIINYLTEQKLIIKKIYVKKGDIVQTDQVLVDFESYQDIKNHNSDNIISE